MGRYFNSLPLRADLFRLLLCFLIDRKVSSMVLIKSFLIVLMSIAFAICKRIFTRNSSALTWKLCFSKQHELLQRRNMMKLSSIWQRSMTKQFLGFSVTQNRNMGWVVFWRQTIWSFYVKYHGVSQFINSHCLWTPHSANVWTHSSPINILVYSTMWNGFEHSRSHR